MAIELLTNDIFKNKINELVDLYENYIYLHINDNKNINQDINELFLLGR